MGGLNHTYQMQMSCIFHVHVHVGGGGVSCFHVDVHVVGSISLRQLIKMSSCCIFFEPQYACMSPIFLICKWLGWRYMHM